MTPPTIDDILNESRTLSAELASLSPDDPRRSALEQRQSELRSQAMDLSLERRHPVSIRNEIAMLEARLNEISGMLIPKGYNEKHLGRTVQDPGAYSRVINRSIAEEHAQEVRDIETRLALLRGALESDISEQTP